MAWFKVDDGFHSSRKVMMIPRKHRLLAAGLWVTAGSWSAQEELDGFVPEYMLDEWGATDEVIDALVRAGMWEYADEGVSFVNWGEYQPTKAELDEKRARDRERKAAWREAKEKKQRLQGASQRDTSVTPGGVRDESALSRPVPSRPVPTRPDPSPLTPIETITVSPVVDARELSTDPETHIALFARAVQTGFSDVGAVWAFIDLVREHTDRDIDPSQALNLVDEIEKKSKTLVRNKIAYARSAVENSPHEIRQLIDAGIPWSSPRLEAI